MCQQRTKIALWCLPPQVLKADSRLACSQREMLSLCNAISHWLGPSLESALITASEPEYPHPGINIDTELDDIMMMSSEGETGLHAAFIGPVGITCID